MQLARQQQAYVIATAIESQFAYIDPNPADFAAIIRLVQTHKLKVHVDAVFPFTAEGLSQAYRHNEGTSKRGKLVIQRKPE